MADINIYSKITELHASDDGAFHLPSYPPLILHSFHLTITTHKKMKGDAYCLLETKQQKSSLMRQCFAVQLGEGGLSAESSWLTG